MIAVYARHGCQYEGYEATICKCSGCVVSGVAKNYCSLCHSYSTVLSHAAFYTHHQSTEAKARAQNKRLFGQVKYVLLGRVKPENTRQATKGYDTLDTQNILYPLFGFDGWVQCTWCTDMETGLILSPPSLSWEVSTETWSESLRKFAPRGEQEREREREGKRENCRFLFQSLLIEIDIGYMLKHYIRVA